MSSKLYILNADREAVEEPDLMTYCRWMDSHEIHVDRETVAPTAFRRLLGWLRGKPAESSLVSTVFLGLDHGWDGKLKLFETMIFGGPRDQEQERCATWDEAVEQHARIVASIKGGE